MEKLFVFFLIKIRYPNDIVVVDRYIYDHLVHYRLSDRRHWGRFRLFFKLLPKADLSFILHSNFETIARARPMYAGKYIEMNLKNYRCLKELCPEVIFIESQELKEKLEYVSLNVLSFLTKTELGG